MHVDYALGNPRNPISYEALCEKFLLCAKHSAKQVPGQKLESLMHSINALESIEDIGSLIDSHL